MPDRMIGEGTDFQKNQLKNPAIHALSAAPSSPVEGQLYYDTVTKKMYYRSDSAWVDTTGGAVTFGAVTAETSYGISSSNGVASTAARSDHTHGTPSLTAVAPSTQAIGDSAVVGTGSAPAREDHKHAMPAFGTPSGTLAFGGSNGAGAAAMLARSDHTHAVAAHDGAAHSAISISSLAVPSADVPWNSKKITGLLDGSAAGDAVNLGQVQGLIATGTNKTAVRVATTAAGTLATGFENTDTVDGVTLATGDRILIKNQASGSENGIYIVAASGAPTRATDADISAEVKGGLSVWVNEGTTNGDTRWVLTTNDPITLGSTALTFTQDFAASATTAGAGLTQSGGIFAVGAGTGISVAADSVAIDTAVVVRKYAVSFGNASASSFTITHNLGTLDVTVECFKNSDGVKWEFGIVHATTNTITVTTGAYVPSSNEFRCVVHG